MANLVALALVAAMLPFGARADQGWRLGPSGYGPVMVGMTRAQAERALGRRLRTLEGKPLGDGCDYLFTSRDDSGLAFLTEAGRIASASTGKRGIASTAGFRVGDDAAKVKAAHGSRLSISEGHYGGYDYYVWEAGGQSGIRYVIDDGRVAEIQAGSSSIAYVEGCD